MLSRCTSSVLLAMLSFCCLYACVSAERIYINEWIVEVKGRPEVADEIARRHGFQNLGKIGNLQEHYRFVLQNTSHILNISEAMSHEEQVGMIEQQFGRERIKKNYTVPYDSRWKYQWSLKNTGQTNGPPGFDLNVEKAWLQGITGEGITVGVVDDGLEWQHSDINDNYDYYASYDFVDGDSDPSPSTSSDSHGTSCAGEIAMVKNSQCGIGVAYKSKVASLKIGLGSNTTDSHEADALGYRNDYIMIYSNSWGPLDTGFIVDGPGTYTAITFRNGTILGRNGKGCIYVFASGNGGQRFDSCAADGYVNSIYTIAVGSADQNGYQADYDEDCASKMAVTYSYNSYQSYNQITTLNLNGGCTDAFTGSSASVPLFSAAIALALDANSDLTWRDIQYLIVYTSDTTKLKGGEWTTNGAGLRVSSQFGFGAIDAEAMVTRAKNWINVPVQLQKRNTSLQTGYAYALSQYEITFEVQLPNIVYLEHIVLNLTLYLEDYGTKYDYYDYVDAFYDYYIDEDDNKDFEDSEYLDEIPKGNRKRDIYDWLEDPHPKRGDIQVELVSPSGTKSILLPYRKYDFVNVEGYDSWPFMSVHYWGENPQGTWTITVHYQSSAGRVSVSMNSFEFYGTSIIPEAVSRIPDQCDDACASGCAAAGPEYCDACKELRNATTLECVDSCSEFDYIEYNGYCVDELYIEDESSNILPYLLPVALFIGILFFVILITAIIIFIQVHRCKSASRKYERVH